MICQKTCVVHYFFFNCYRVLKILNSVCSKKKLRFSRKEMNFKMNLLKSIMRLNKRDPGSLVYTPKKSSCCKMLRMKLSLWRYKFAVILVLCSRYSHEMSLSTNYFCIWFEEITDYFVSPEPRPIARYWSSAEGHVEVSKWHIWRS